MRCPLEHDNLFAKLFLGSSVEICPKCAGLWVDKNILTDICVKFIKSKEDRLSKEGKTPKFKIFVWRSLMKCPNCGLLFNKERYEPADKNKVFDDPVGDCRYYASMWRNQYFLFSCSQCSKIWVPEQYQEFIFENFPVIEEIKSSFLKNPGR